MSATRPVLFLDPYHTASHRALSVALRDRSRHPVTLLTLPPRKWKWRMRGAALAFEPMVRSLPSPLPGILVTTDFLNLSEFLALTRDLWTNPPKTIVYFHENQLTYPAASSDVRDFHFGLINLHTALASDRVVFNSGFHRDEFLREAEILLERMPDFRPAGIGGRILARSEVLGMPVEVSVITKSRRAEREPWVLWNHRWEADREPGVFFDAMRTLDRMAEKGEAPQFRLVVAGQTYREQPSAFGRAREDLSHRLAHWGFVESREAYLELLGRCAAVVSTSRHEFFGVGVIEAILAGCIPVLPRRLVYPSLTGGDGAFLYDDPAEIPARTAAAIEAATLPRGTHPSADALRNRREALASRLEAFDSPRVVARWDDIIDEI